MSSTQHNEIKLHDVLHEFVLTAERPDANSLEEFVKKYPQFSMELTNFAAEWLLQDLLPENEASKEKAASSALISKTMSRLQNKLYEVDHTEANREQEINSNVNPFEGYQPTELKKIARSLGIDTTIMAKLKNGRIEGEIPDKLCIGFAKALDVPLQAIKEIFSGPSTIQAQASFKSHAKPEVITKETFEEAVLRSTLSEEEKAKWLN